VGGLANTCIPRLLKIFWLGISVMDEIPDITKYERFAMNFPTHPRLDRWRRAMKGLTNLDLLRQISQIVSFVTLI
jgi:hypothetical protein